jgi:hypothetical protein
VEGNGSKVPNFEADVVVDDDGDDVLINAREYLYWAAFRL